MEKEAMTDKRSPEGRKNMEKYQCYAKIPMKKRESERAKRREAERRNERKNKGQNEIESVCV